MPKAALILLLSRIPALAALAASPQSASVSANLPSFDAATIKPPDPAAPYRKSGFYGEPGGRVFFGGNMKMLIECAFNPQHYQVAGGADWNSSQWFEINAVPPETSSSLNIKVENAEPTSEQRLMLQSLLADRFGFQYHFETKEGKVYILTRGAKPLQLKPPKDPASDPRAVVWMKSGWDLRRGSRGHQHLHGLPRAETWKVSSTSCPEPNGNHRLIRLLSVAR
jgi:uncharacterized protein (TIGR03435 family)